MPKGKTILFINKIQKPSKGFSLIELLVVIVLIAIISIIAFINFGNQSSKARNAMRLDSSSKIATAFQLKYTQDEFDYKTCEEAGLKSYILTGSLTGTGCNIILDGTDSAKSFLKKLGITGTFQDPLNKTLPDSGNTFIYEFNYKLNSPLYEFVYLTEPKEDGSLINLNKSYALEYNTGSLDILNIDGNTSLQSSFSPIILKSTGSLIGDLPVNEQGVKVFNKTPEVLTFLMNDERVAFNKINRQTSVNCFGGTTFHPEQNKCDNLTSGSIISPTTGITYNSENLGEGNTISFQSELTNITGGQAQYQVMISKWGGVVRIDMENPIQLNCNPGLLANWNSGTCDTPLTGVVNGTFIGDLNTYNYENLMKGQSSCYFNANEIKDVQNSSFNQITGSKRGKACFSVDNYGTVSVYNETYVYTCNIGYYRKGSFCETIPEGATIVKITSDDLKTYNVISNLYDYYGNYLEGLVDFESDYLYYPNYYDTCKINNTCELHRGDLVRITSGQTSKLVSVGFGPDDYISKYENMYFSIPSAYNWINKGWATLSNPTGDVIGARLEVNSNVETILNTINKSYTFYSSTDYSLSPTGSVLNIGALRNSEGSTSYFTEGQMNFLDLYINHDTHRLKQNYYFIYMSDYAGWGAYRGSYATNVTPMSALSGKYVKINN